MIARSLSKFNVYEICEPKKIIVKSFEFYNINVLWLEGITLIIIIDALYKISCLSVCVHIYAFNTIFRKKISYFVLSFIKYIVYLVSRLMQNVYSVKLHIKQCVFTLQILLQVLTFSIMYTKLYLQLQQTNVTYSNGLVWIQGRQQCSFVSLYLDFSFWSSSVYL